MNFFFLIKEGIVSLRRARLTALISVITICLSLTLIGVFLLAGQNVKDIFVRFYKQVEIEVFLEPSLSDRQIKDLKKKIEDGPQVSEVKYISRQQALEEFQKTFGEDLSNVLSENPLPASFRIVLKPSYSAPSVVEDFAEKTRKLAGVQEVLYQKEIITFIQKYFSLTILFIGFLAIILFIIITILVFNTIRLTIHARTDIIQIMRLVGATNFFIKSPFIIEGIIQGIFGGFLAWGLLSLLSKFVQSIIYPELVVASHLYLLIIGLGIAFGWIGSYLSVNKYLRY
jgi:cell division transport system permease protein